jgi:hypothetical protein
MIPILSTLGLGEAFVRPAHAITYGRASGSTRADKRVVYILRWPPLPSPGRNSLQGGLLCWLFILGVNTSQHYWALKWLFWSRVCWFCDKPNLPIYWHLLRTINLPLYTNTRRALIQLIEKGPHDLPRTIQALWCEGWAFRNILSCDDNLHLNYILFSSKLNDVSIWKKF